MTDVIFETDSRKKYFKQVGLVILLACQILISGVYIQKFADFVLLRTDDKLFLLRVLIFNRNLWWRMVCFLIMLRAQMFFCN